MCGCVQVFHLAAAGCEANKEIYSTCANSHTQRDTHRQSQLNAILHGILKIFCFAQFVVFFSRFFLVAFWVPIVCNISAVGGACAGAGAGAAAWLAALFILLCAHYARPATTITMKTVFNEIFEQVSHSQQRASGKRRRGNVFSTYAEKYAAISCCSSEAEPSFFVFFVFCYSWAKCELISQLLIAMGPSQSGNLAIRLRARDSTI